MRFAEKEVEQLELKAREEAGLPVEPADEGGTLAPVDLPAYSIMRKQLRVRKKKQAEADKLQLEEKVAEVEGQMKEVQDRLKILTGPGPGGASPVREHSEKEENVASEKENNHHARKAASAAVENGKDGTPEENSRYDNDNGAIGPDGQFVEFPSYTGTEPPRECKKAFTHFCLHTRKEVKASLDQNERKNKVRQSISFLRKNCVRFK